MSDVPSILWFLADWRICAALVVLEILVFGAAIGGAVLFMFRKRQMATGIEQGKLMGGQ